MRSIHSDHLSTEMADRAVVAAVLGRADRLADRDGELWGRFEALLGRADARSAAVLANLAALVLLDDDADVEVATELMRVVGRDALARRQLHILRTFKEAGRCGLAEPFLRRLRTSRRDDALTLLAAVVLHDAIDLPEATGLRSGTTAVPRTSPSVTAGYVDGHLAGWREWVAEVGVAPWGPSVVRARNLAERQSPEVAAVLARIVEVARDVVETRERRAVAEHVRRLVTSTGLAQKEFASRVGTSPSRLSTYVSGKVTPSAAMVVRMTRVARTLATAQLPQRVAT